MRGRYVAILLTITAVSAVILLMLSLLDNEAQAAAIDNRPAVAALPDTLSVYEETVSIGPDGNAHVEIFVVLGSGGQVDLLLPCEYENGDDFSILSGPVQFGGESDRLAPSTVEILGRRRLNLQTRPSATAGDSVRIEARVADWFQRDTARRPYGEFRPQRGDINDSDFVYRKFRLNLVLAPGMVVHAVEKVVPDFDPEKNSTPPFVISRVDDRVRATLAVQDLPPAGSVYLRLGIRPARRGLIPLSGGLNAAVLYLVFFRDVLKPKEVEPPCRSSNPA